MRTLLSFLLLFATLLGHFAVAQKYEIGPHFKIEIDDTDTVFAVNRNRGRIRLSQRGIARNLILYNDTFYLIDKSGNLFRLERARFRLLSLNLLRTALTSGGFFLGANAGFMISGHPPPIIETLPWVITAVTSINLMPPSYLARLRFFDGADFFTEKLDSGVQSVFRTRAGNYELIFGDNRKDRLLGNYPLPDAEADSCEIWLSRVW